MGLACTRQEERFYSAIGVLNGAKSNYKESYDVVYGGVMTSLPALIENGLFSSLDKLGIVNGYYKLEHILHTAAFMFLCRLKNVENMKKCSPGEFGILIGLDRIPEGHCMRKKLDYIAGAKNADEWSAEITAEWMKKHSDVCGFLYVDGHVKIYSGKEKLPKRYVSRQRLCLHGISNYWVNDAIGRPFFWIEKQIDSGLIETLESDIVPRLLRDVPNQPTDEELERDPCLFRFVIVFDREGYSPAFFKRMWEKHRIACLTYRKNCFEQWDENLFISRQVIMSDNEIVNMKLAEKEIVLGSKTDEKIACKEVRKLTDSGHQTAIITTALSLKSDIVAPAIFTRWCQENFFKYAMKHFPIEALTSYGKETFPGTEKVVNPVWRNLDREANSLRSKLIRRRAKSVEMDSSVSADPHSKGHNKWLAKKGELMLEIENMEKELKNVKSRKKDTKHYIKWDELSETDKFMKLPSSRRKLINTIAMIAYRAETAMASLMSNLSHISLSKARAIIQNLFLMTADIIPDTKNKRLQVVLHGSATKADNEKIKTLLDYINQSETIVPDTDLRIEFNIIKTE